MQIIQNCLFALIAVFLRMDQYFKIKTVLWYAYIYLFILWTVSYKEACICVSPLIWLVQIFGGRRPELRMLIELLSDAENFSVG